LYKHQNHSKFLELRKKYPTFVFKSYSYERTKTSLKAEFSFSLADEIFFHPSVQIPSRSFYDFDQLGDAAIDLLVFNIGMVELISYWKAACPQQLIIQAHRLDDEQIAWWKKLYFYGLGEFFYLNGIKAGQDDFMSIISMGKISRPSTIKLSENKVLVPIGGGKDSVVSMELLKDSGLEILPFIMNPREASLRTIKIGGFDCEASVIVNRKLDKRLLELNEEGFLNGHTPFSALLAFVSSLTALASASRYIALSNENSANESTVPGSNINHQYSKSFEFEQDFGWYVQHYIHPDLYYFSFLRPLNELQIAFLFSQYPQHFLSFRSCNVESKTDSWCGHCPKCLFTYIILSPFIPTKTMEQIFNKNLLNDLALLPILKELDGTLDVKPFECVGTPHEVNTALWKTIQLIRKAKLPELLKGKEVKDGLEAVVFNKLLADRSAKHRAPEKLHQLLNTAFDKAIKVNRLECKDIGNYRETKNTK